jgi:hypothetical protein
MLPEEETDFWLGASELSLAKVWDNLQDNEYAKKDKETSNMISDDLGKQLHDRATRGQPLSAEERELLAEWYRRLDEEEARQFAKAATTPPQSVTRTEINNLLTQLALSAQHMLTVAAENEKLRQEIEDLHRQLAQKRTVQSA